MPEYQNVKILPVKITVTNAGVVTAESKSTDKEYKNIIGFAITYDSTDNLPGSSLNISIGGRSLWKKNVETALFTFNSACPVNGRYYNYTGTIPVDNSAIEISYTPGAAFPTGDTIITVSFQCTTE